MSRPARRPDPGADAPAGRERYGELIRQYLDLRDQHPGIILLFRVGSFYEVLFEDAELVARELGLKLSERPSGGAAGPVAQCGFAHHALASFLPRLLGRGYRVAVCEESEEEAGGIRRRAVVRTLTPGTITDPALLPEDRPTYLVALVSDTDLSADTRLGLAWTDLAAGEFKAGEFDPTDAAAELQRLAPAEVLVPAGARIAEALTVPYAVTPVAAADGSAESLRRAFPATSLTGLPLAQSAAGLVLRYLEQTQGDDLPALDAPTETGTADSLRLDAATQRHLEIVETERGRERSGSLLGTIDWTVTPMGRRLLRTWLLRPLTDAAKIATRQRIVAELLANPALSAALAAQLAELADLERLAGRVAARRATLDDLRALTAAGESLPALAGIVASSPSPFLRALGKDRPGLRAFAEQARKVLAPPETDPPIRPEANAELAAAMARVAGAVTWQAEYLAAVRRRPGLGRTKIERTSTQGIFLEVPVNTVAPEGWIRRGGVQKSERYTTPELDQHAAELAEAEAEIAEATKAALGELRGSAAAVATEARELARFLAAADVLLSFARCAAERNWTLPTIDADETLEIVGGRHPVLESLVDFQPNDARLTARGTADQIVVLTGPNMAGKSTWMRQVALIVLLAQAGSAVPATTARIGLADAIYTRIGAVDDLAGGRSTFMVEMSETAAVLRGATDRGLVLLDEIGRGTSTHDGMAIAWSVIEHLATGPVRPRGIVATHYHELAALAADLPQIVLRRAGVAETPAGITFTHRIEAGAADRSFGIDVARLAGLPPEVLDRAREVAAAIEPISAEIARRLPTRRSPVI